MPPDRCHTIDINKGHTMPRTITKQSALSQFRYNWKVATLVQPSLKTDTIAKREYWANFVDALNKEGYVSDSQAYRWSNPF